MDVQGEFITFPVNVNFSILDKTFRVVAVGIGDDVDESALNLMASLPSEDNTHKISSWDNLPDIAQEVAYDVCQVTTADFNTRADGSVYSKV